MTIVTVIPVGIENAARAEFLVDFIAQLNQRQPRGHALLVFDGTHEEYIARVRIAADLAFVSHDILTPASKDTKEKMASAVARRNNVFMSAALYCQSNFRCPWMWLEPETCPTNPQWMENIENMYEGQARRYALCHLRDSETSPRFPLAVGVWHMGAYNDLNRAMEASLETPFERVAGEVVVSRSTKTKMFQPLKIETESDFSKVWPEAQIVVGDTVGILIEKLRADGVHLPKVQTAREKANEFRRVFMDNSETLRIPTVTLDPPSLPPQLTQPNPTADGRAFEQHPERVIPKPDLRTKEGRAWKAANGNGQPH